MGMVQFALETRGKDAKGAFNRLVEEALAEYGDDPYNGTISTCSYAGCRAIAGKCTPEVIQKAKGIIEEDGNGEKWEARAIDCGTCGYIVTEVMKKPSSPAEKPTFGSRYVVLERYFGYEKPVDGGIFTRKTDAEKMAETLTAKNADSEKTYCVAKRPVITKGGSDYVAEYEARQYRTDGADKPKAKKNAIVEEEHFFIFYGWAGA